MAIGDQYRVSVLLTQGGVNIANTVLLSTVSPSISGDEWEDAGQSYVNSVWSSLLPYLSDTLSLVGFRVRRVYPTPGPGYYFDSPSVGAVSGGALSTGACAVVGLTTDLPSRRGRGRIKLAGLSSADVEAGRLSEVLRDNLDAALASLLSAVSNGDGSFRVGLSPFPPAFQGFTGVQIRSRVRTQRSRQVV